MTSMVACMVLQLSSVINVFLLRSRGGSYHGGSSSVYTRSVIGIMIMESVKVVKRELHKPTGSDCRHHSHDSSSTNDKPVQGVVSMLDNTCSSRKHDRRSTKKIAVSTINDASEIALDLMWLIRYICQMVTLW